MTPEDRRQLVRDHRTAIFGNMRPVECVASR
jgi:hypothetical protein